MTKDSQKAPPRDMTKDSQKAPWGWKMSKDPEDNTIFVSKMGTQVYAMPEFPVYCTTAKVQAWVRFYDTTTQQFYYSNSFTGETTFEIPPLYKKQLKDQLPFPIFQRSALLMQRVVRVRQAHVRVNCKRAQMHQKFAGAHARYIKTFHPHHHAYYWCNPTAKEYSWDQPQPSTEYDFSIQSKSQREKYPKWSRLWDPTHNQHYYYNNFEGTHQYTKPPEYNAAMWAVGFRSGYPPAIKSALTIQTAYRRKTVEAKIHRDREVRENMTAGQRRKYLEKKAVDLAKKKREMVLRREQEREMNETASLAHEEALQRVRGDTFWGLDVAKAAKQHLLEVQKHMKNKQKIIEEEKVLKKQEAIDRKKNMKAGRRKDMKREIVEETEMGEEEEEQRNYGDTFWGVDRQEHDRKKSLKNMMKEDVHSRRREGREKLEFLHKRWGKELKKNETEEKLLSATADLHRRGNYMNMFYDSYTSDTVLKYVWPGSRTLLNNETSKAKGKNSNDNKVGFPMPDVYSKRRLEAPASIYHALNSLRSAPPAAAHDFLLDEHLGKGFVLLPHLHHCQVEAMQKGAVPPEMVQRQLDSRRNTASRSLLSPSRAEAKRMREVEQQIGQTHTSKIKNKKQNGPRDGTEEKKTDQLESSSTLGEFDQEETPENNDIYSGNGGSAIIEKADVRGIFTSVSEKKTMKNKRKKIKRKKKSGKNGVPNYLKPKSSTATVPKRMNTKSNKGVKSSANSILQDASTGAAVPPPPPPPPPPPTQVVVGFSLAQTDRLRQMFVLMDADQSGYVDQHEMMVALRTNKDVARFMGKSKLLAPLLLDPELSRRFMNMHPRSKDGIDFSEFVEFMQENSDEATVVEDMTQVEQEEMNTNGARKQDTTIDVVFNGEPISANTSIAKILPLSSSQSKTSGIGALLRRIYKMIDTNNTSTMGKREFLLSLKAVPDIKDFVHKLPKVEQLFSSKQFLNEFQTLNDPCTCLEFVELGVKVASGLSEKSVVEPMTPEEIVQLRKIIEQVMGEGRDPISPTKLARLLLSTKISAQLTSASPALEGLLKPRTFRKALAALDIDDDKTITTEEVVQFCVSFVC